jgi:HK97 family phage major capsid protein
MISTVEWRANRHKLLEESRAITDKADGEKRQLTAEERTQWDKLYTEAGNLKTQIDDAERRNEIEGELLAAKNSQDEERAKKAGSEKTSQPAGRRAFDTPEYRSAFSKHLCGLPFTPEEQRALQAGSGTAGGYLYAPEQFVSELIQNVTDATVFRTLARVWPPIVGSDSLGAPVLVNRMAAAAWTSELGAPSTDSTLSFGKREIRPYPLAKEILVSKTLLRKVANADAIVRGELSRVVAEAMENAYMTGTGDQQPLGIFTASTVGVSTSRDVSTSNTSTSVTFDGLKTAKYTLKQAYWPGARWIMHRDLMAQIAKLKDGDGRYLLQDSVAQGEGDRLLAFPIVLSEYAPNTFSSAQYVAMLGDYSQLYWIVDSQDMEIQVLEEYYARQNQNDFIIRMATDGAPVLEEACVRVKLGT